MESFVLGKMNGDDYFVLTCLILWYQPSCSTINMHNGINSSTRRPRHKVILQVRGTVSYKPFLLVLVPYDALYDAQLCYVLCADLAWMRAPYIILRSKAFVFNFLCVLFVPRSPTSILLLAGCRQGKLELSICRLEKLLLVCSKQTSYWSVLKKLAIGRF